jgi:hypothetical protein
MKAKLTDKCIAHLVKLLQVALISGTDIVDHLRMMQLVYDAQTMMLELDEEYEDIFEASLNKMLSEVEKIQTEDKEY